MTARVLSLFSGGGGLDLGLETAGAQMLQEGIQQGIRTAVRAVAAGVLCERFTRSGIHMLARQEIRHADRETDDVATFRLELLGLLGHHHDGAGLRAAHAFG